MKKLVRITTVPLSLEKLLEGQLSFMQQYYKVIAVSSEEDRLTKFEKEVGVPTFCIEMTRKITPAKDLKSLWKLYRFLKKEKPLIVHTHTPKAGIAGMMAAKMAGVPLRLHTVAGLPLLEAKGAKRRLLEYVEKWTFSSATNVYPNSHKIYDYLKQYKFVSEEKLKVIGNGSSNGINTAYFDPNIFSEEEKEKTRTSLLIPPKDVVFIFVGRLVRDKGINELVAAFEQVHLEFPETSLLLVGPVEAELDPLLPETLEKMRSHPKIMEVGYQVDIRPFMSIAEVLSFPSYREGFPNVVMQAGAMGLASIVTNINGCNEIVKEGINGTIVPVRDSGALFKAMKKMIIDPKYRQALKANSRKIIKEKYERQEIWKALLAEYKDLEAKLKKTK
jgi:glycosyltransferase involved in cell wall biosynthesis